MRGLRLGLGLSRRKGGGGDAFVPGYIIMLDSRDEESITGLSSGTLRWADKSGFGNDITQSVADSKFTYETDERGIKYLQGDGVDDFANFPAVLNGGVAGDNTLFVGYRSDTSQPVGWLMASDNGGGNYYGISQSDSGGGFNRYVSGMFGSSIGLPVTPDDDVHIDVIRKGGTDLEARHDDQIGTGTSGGDGSPASGRLFAFGGSGFFKGGVYFILYYPFKLTDEEVAHNLAILKRAFMPLPALTALAGQSLPVNMALNASAEFTAAIRPLIPTERNTLLNGATGGSQMINSNGSDYHYNVDTDTFGPAMDTFEAAIASANVSEIKATHIQQGQSDYVQTFNHLYVPAALKVLDRIYEVTGSKPIIITVPFTTSNPGEGWDGTTDDESVQMIRENWWSILTQRAYLERGPEIHDLEKHEDNVHLTSASDKIYAERLARVEACIRGAEVEGSVYGPEIDGDNVTLVGTTMTIPILHDAGTDFTGDEGLYVTDDGIEVPYAFVPVDGNTIQLTLSEAPTGVVILHNVYGNNYGITDGENVVKDNSPQALPLRAGKWAIAY